MRVARAAALAAALLFSGAGKAAAAAPAPLSSEKAPVDMASTYGSGAFGQWTVDARGLPAYRYDIEELTSPFAPQSELSGNRNAWSQVGNDRVVADASNHGYTQLWSQDRLYQWTNYYDAEHQHYAEQGAVGLANRRSAITNRNLSPILGQEQRMIGQASDGPKTQNLVDGILHRLSGVFVNDAKDFK